MIKLIRTFLPVTKLTGNEKKKKEKKGHVALDMPFLALLKGP
jgi:hypothetical protein